MPPKELAYRTAEGAEIYLLWHQADNRLTVVVDDTHPEASFVLLVEEDESPLDVFYHPYAYSARVRAGATILQEVR